jgi:type IV pilus assembly protein PilY1
MVQRSRFGLSSLVVALAALVFLGGFTAPLDGQGFVGNAAGDLILGVNVEGHLNIPSAVLGTGDPVNGPSDNGAFTIGLTYTPLGDATSPGCLCEGWGVAGDGTSGFANVSTGGPVNLTVGSFATDGAASIGTFATSVVTLTSLPDLRVTHAYTISAATDSLFQAVVTIENLGAVPITDILYRRVMDWDVPPTEFSEFVTIGGWPAANLLATSDNGFASADPLSGVTDINSCGTNVNFTDCGPADHGALFDFSFGDLAPGDSVTFNIFYGATPTEALAFAALAAVGAEVFSLGQQNGDPGSGTPATFIFAFKGVGGTPVTGVPEPSTIALFGTALLGLAACSRKRRNS